MQSIDTNSLNEQLRGEHAPGFHLYPGFCASSVGQAMLSDVIGLARRAAAGDDVECALVLPEGQAGMQGEQPEDVVSKVFKLHRRPLFADFLKDPRIRDILLATIGTDVDCFLSQSILTFATNVRTQTMAMSK